MQNKYCKGNFSFTLEVCPFVDSLHYRHFRLTITSYCGILQCRHHRKLENISPCSIPLILMSMCMIGYEISELHMRLTVRNMAAYLFWIILMAVLYYEMEAIIRSFLLYIVSMVHKAGIDLCMKLPGIAFYGVYKLIFYLILPYGIMATLPVQSLIGEINLQTAIYGSSIVILF